MTLADKINTCRRQQGLSQETLAAQLNVSRQAVSKWETGDAEPESGKLVALAQTFGVTVDWLLSSEDPVPEQISTPLIQTSQGHPASKPKLEKKVFFGLRPAYIIYLVWLMIFMFFAMTITVDSYPERFRFNPQNLHNFFEPNLLIFMLTGGILLLCSSGLMRGLVWAFRFMICKQDHENCSTDRLTVSRHAVHAVLNGWILGGLLDITAIVIKCLGCMDLSSSAIKMTGYVAHFGMNFLFYTITALLVFLPIEFALKKQQNS